MQTNVLGKTGLRVTPLGFGGAPFGYLGVEESQAERLLHAVLDHGIRVIDTAECYPGSEEAIGRALSSRRSEFVLLTKCGHKVEGASGEEWSARLISETVDRSLRQLRTDRIDVVFLHSCDLETLKRGEALGALVRARDAGKVRWVGYSGDNEAALYALGLPEVSVLETSVSICDQSAIDRLLPRARERQVGVVAKRPLANAAWRKPYEEKGIYIEYSRVYRERFEKMRLDPAELGFPGEPASVWPEIALRFTLFEPGVSTAIVGTTNPERIARNVAAAERGPLPPGAVAKIREAFRKAEAESGETWEGQV